MVKLITYYAHPGHRYSRVNRAMAEAAQSISGVTFCDLYEKYPRFQIDVDHEQSLLVEHEVVVFQFPMFWYSTPSLIKEWLDLVLEHGFAYGAGGDHLTGKSMMLAISAAGSEEAYQSEGYQNFPIRTFLTPLEQTARLCKMKFLPPYVLFSSLQADEGSEIKRHADGYVQLLKALQDGRYDQQKAAGREFITCENLPITFRAL